MALDIPALAAAAGCGALIGSIRQWHEQKNGSEQTVDFGGLRTHTLWALLGCLAAGFPWALPAVLVLVAGHLIAQRWAPGAAERNPGGTGFAAALLTVLIGALTNSGDIRVAALVTALTVVLLGLKEPIHDWTRRFTPTDIRAALQFAAITGIVLPLVPNRFVDPWELLNPFKIWLLVVFISGLGFAGYVAMRILGAKAGITVTALLGGLASSTASTLAFARQSREEPSLAKHHAFAVVVACTVMLPRMAIAAALFSPALAWSLTWPLLAMGAPALVFAIGFWLRRPADGEIEPPAVANPLGLRAALTFAALYAIIAAVVTLATRHGWQESALLPLSFVSGLTQVDAITLSVAQSARDGAMAPEVAAHAVVVAAIANSLLKGGLAAWLGAPALRWPVVLVLAVTSMIGGAWVALA